MLGLTQKDLCYAAHSRCQCGAGLAYLPSKTNHPALEVFKGNWYCSAIMLGDEQEYTKAEDGGMFGKGKVVGADGIAHDTAYPFAFFEIKSEIQPSAYGHTTRPTEQEE